MSYCRFSNADAYIYDDVDYGLYCCGCRLDESGGYAAGKSVAAMLAHIRDHRAAGHHIPDFVDQALIDDREAYEPPEWIIHLYETMQKFATPCEGNHRGPQGPNEDLSVCSYCHMPSYSMRPWGETIGTHKADCSLPIWHEGYCVGGGAGHPEAPRIRG
jgi:hypothetical protein